MPMVRKPNMKFFSQLRDAFGGDMFNLKQAYDVYFEFRPRDEKPMSCFPADTAFAEGEVRFQLGRMVYHGKLERLAPGWYMVPAVGE